MMHKCIMVKKRKLRKKANITKIGGKFINFAAMGRKFINFVEIGGKRNMYHWLRGMDAREYTCCLLQFLKVVCVVVAGLRLLR